LEDHELLLAEPQRELMDVQAAAHLSR